MIENPFSTCYTRPGKMDFHGSISPIELARLIDKNQRPWQICGPHGSGKTSLTVFVSRELNRLGFQTRWITIQRDSRFQRLALKFDELADMDSQQNFGSNPSRSCLFVDGIESLNHVCRLSVIHHLPKRFDRVVFTAHRRLPFIHVLAQTVSSFSLFRNLCEELIKDAGGQSRCRIDEDKFERAYRDANGNIREAFFRLYDEWEVNSAQLQSS